MELWDLKQKKEDFFDISQNCECAPLDTGDLAFLFYFHSLTLIYCIPRVYNLKVRTYYNNTSQCHVSFVFQLVELHFKHISEDPLVND